MNVLPLDLAKSRNREIRVQAFPIVPKFDRHLDSSDSCQISERYDHKNIQPHYFENLRYCGMSSVPLVDICPGPCDPHGIRSTAFVAMPLFNMSPCCCPTGCWLPKAERWHDVSFDGATGCQFQHLWCRHWPDDYSGSSLIVSILKLNTINISMEPLTRLGHLLLKFSFYSDVDHKIYPRCNPMGISVVTYLLSVTDLWLRNLFIS